MNLNRKRLVFVLALCAIGAVCGLALLAQQYPTGATYPTAATPNGGKDTSGFINPIFVNDQVISPTITATGAANSAVIQVSGQNSVAAVITTTGTFTLVPEINYFTTASGDPNWLGTNNHFNYQQPNAGGFSTGPITNTGTYVFAIPPGSFAFRLRPTAATGTTTVNLHGSSVPNFLMGAYPNTGGMFPLAITSSGHPTVEFPTAVADPCEDMFVAKSSAVINITSATTTSLVAVSGSTTVYVCGFSLTISEVVTTANTFQLEYGTGATCGGGTTALTGLYGAGGVTAAAPIVISVGNGSATVAKSAASNGVCAVTAIGASGTFQGLITFVQQ